MRKLLKTNDGLRASLRCAGLVVGFCLLGGCFDRVAEGPGFDPQAEEVRDGLTSILPAGGRIFVNQATAGWFVEQKFEAWQIDELDQAERLRAGVDPAFWRVKDRARRYDAVAVLGEPGDARPLVAHLMESPDWRLAWVGSSGCLFARSSLREKPLLTRRSSAQTAHWLIEVGMLDEARRMIERLEDADRDHVEFLRTFLLTEERDWVGVIERTEAAQGRFAEALLVLRARAFLERGDGKAAWRTMRSLAQRKDADAATLFLYARACRAAHAWEEEVRALQRVISLLDAAGAPTSTYQVYLGQACSSAGKKKEALASFREAVADPALPQAQRDFAETAIKRLESL